MSGPDICEHGNPCSWEPGDKRPDPCPQCESEGAAWRAKFAERAATKALEGSELHERCKFHDRIVKAILHTFDNADE
jgi:hypothetical protein